MRGARFSVPSSTTTATALMPLLPALTALGVSQCTKHSHLSFIGAPSNGSLYVSVNGFSGDRRRLDSLRQINALFFDLDCHGSSRSQTDNAICNALEIISEAVRIEKLPRPTLTIDSGSRSAPLLCLEPLHPLSMLC